MSDLRVSDGYRTNELSLQPGGYEVTVVYENGKRFIYDKVKKPGNYVKSIALKPTANGEIVEILVNNMIMWQRGVGDKQPWEI